MRRTKSASYYISHQDTHLNPAHSCLAPSRYPLTLSARGGRRPAVQRSWRGPVAAVVGEWDLLIGWTCDTATNHDLALRTRFRGPSLHGMSVDRVRRITKREREPPTRAQEQETVRSRRPITWGPAGFWRNTSSEMTDKFSYSSAMSESEVGVSVQ